MKIACIISLIIAGCATSPRYQESDKLRACRFDATKATAGGTFYGARTVVGGAYAEHMAYQQVLDACMAQ